MRKVSTFFNRKFSIFKAKKLSILHGQVFSCKNKISLGEKNDIFNIFVENIDCGYPQTMFWTNDKKSRYIPFKPKFFYIKVGVKGIYISRTIFPDEMLGIMEAFAIALYKII